MKKLLILALSSLVLTQALYSYTLNNVAQNGARWRSYPVTLDINTAGSGLPDSDVMDVITGDMNKWNEAIGFSALELGEENRAPSSTAMDTDGKNQIVFSTNFQSDSKGFDPKSAVAIAGQYGDGYSMTDAFIIFNAEYVAWNTDSNVSTAKKTYSDHLPTIALHELGHVLGLGHSQNTDAVMAAVRQTKIITDLTADDVEGAKFVTSVGSAAGSAGQGQSYSNDNSSSSKSGGCGTIAAAANGNGGNGGNIGGNAAVMLLPMLALFLVRRRAVEFSHQ
jgi:hypothetical protein